MVAPLVHLLVSGGPSDQARAARALSNMATDSSVKQQIVAAGMALPIVYARSCTQGCVQRIPAVETFLSFSFFQREACCEA